MPRKRPRSAGVRNPERKALGFAIASLLALGLVAVGLAEMRATGRSGSPWLALGVLPALRVPVARAARAQAGVVVDRYHAKLGTQPP